MQERRPGASVVTLPRMACTRTVFSWRPFRPVARAESCSLSCRATSRTICPSRTVRGRLPCPSSSSLRSTSTAARLATAPSTTARTPTTLELLASSFSVRRRRSRTTQLRTRRSTQSAWIAGIGRRWQRLPGMWSVRRLAAWRTQTWVRAATEGATRQMLPGNYPSQPQSWMASPCQAIREPL